MEQLNRILQVPLIVFGDVSITMAQVLTVLALLVGGIFFVLWSGRFLRSRMLKRSIDPNVVQLTFRAYLILGMAIVGMSTLDLLSVPLAAFAFV
ncbi:MAG TPA: mechanosensitive ion channel protein, partial [Halieaceae bacterium]|nr:mechanosensitive ion channel protein [Halieaceae bacterium]